ncbi:MAG: NUDIX hydrolase [Actinomycetes bacterium]
MVSRPELRQAATVMLVRNGPSSEAIEVLMVRRNLNSDFVGGAYVFPGGAVDLEDSGDIAANHVIGLSDAAASEVLGLERGGLAYWVAVLRELFEEAGILLTAHEATDALAVNPDSSLRLAVMRDELNARARSFLSIAEAEQLVLDVSKVHYFAHWITPEGAPRRYDTRFFVAAAPEGQVAVHDNGETIDAVWIDPLHALERHRAGEIEIIFPTIKNLQAIGRFTRVDELLQAAREASEIPAILPRLTSDDRGVRILLPGDDDYDRVAAGPLGDAKSSFTDAIRAISRAANPEPRS